MDDLTRRFAYHAPPTPERVTAHQAVRDALLQVARQFETNLPPGREKSLALTKLEEAMFWANAGIARQAAVDEQLADVIPLRTVA